MGKLSIEKNKVLREWKETEIGKIPKDWGIVNIEDLLSDKKNAIAMGPFGSNITKDNFVSNGVPIIRGNNLKPYKFSEEDFVYVTKEKSVKLKASWVERKDLVITHRGTLGQVCIIPENSKYEKYIISQSGLKISLDEKKINPFFCYYFLRSRIGQHLLLRNKSQVGVPAIAQPTTSIKKIPIPIPALYVQEKIAKILSDFDDKIENNNEMNKTLEEMAQTLFKRWFIDFEFPNENGEPYKSSGGKMVDSELGEIPEGWEVGKYGDLVKLNGLSTKKGDHLRNLPYVPIDCIPKKSLGLQEFKSWREAESSLQLFNENDILFGAMRSYFHKVVISPFKGITRKTCFILTPLEISDLSYITLLTFQENTVDYANSNSKGTTMPYAVWENGLENMRIIMPSKNIKEKFNSLVYPLLNNIKSSLLSNKSLTEIRDTLLPKLMSGEIEV